MMKLLNLILPALLILGPGMAHANDGGAQKMIDATEPASEKMTFAIVYRAGPAWKPGVPMEQQGLRDHFYYINALHKEGRLIVAGPLGSDGGLIILYARDQADADSVIAADPAVTAGLFTGTATRFIPRFVSKEPLSAVAP